MTVEVKDAYQEHVERKRAEREAAEAAAPKSAVVELTRAEAGVTMAVLVRYADQLEVGTLERQTEIDLGNAMLKLDGAIKRTRGG